VQLPLILLACDCPPQTLLGIRHKPPQKLAAFRDPLVKASEKDIARSLEGNWQEDLLFVLKQEQAAFEFCRKQMAECDQLEQYLQKREDRSQGATLLEEKRKDRLRKKKGNQPQFDTPSGNGGGSVFSRLPICQTDRTPTVCVSQVIIPSAALPQFRLRIAMDDARAAVVLKSR
jgi:hypothetical protein